MVNESSKTKEDPPVQSKTDRRIPYEDEERLEKLFKELDTNGDGRIDIHDLTQVLEKRGVPQATGHAQVNIGYNIGYGIHIISDYDGI